MSSRDTIEDLERQLDEAKRSYLRAQGWNVTYKTPGSAMMWQRDFDRGMIMADTGTAIEITMISLDDPERRPDADSDE